MSRNSLNFFTRSMYCILDSLFVLFFYCEVQAVDRKTNKNGISQDVHG